MARPRTAEQMYTIPEVAALTRLGRATVYRRIASGELRVVNLGTKRRTKMRVPESALAAYQGAPAA
jgi:excisionase family DNA binding protein